MTAGLGYTATNAHPKPSPAMTKHTHAHAKATVRAPPMAQGTPLSLLPITQASAHMMPVAAWSQTWHEAHET